MENHGSCILQTNIFIKQKQWKAALLYCDILALKTKNKNRKNPKKLVFEYFPCTVVDS